MKVIFLKSYRNQAAGSAADLRPEMAKWLINRGLCVEQKEEPTNADVIAAAEAQLTEAGFTIDKEQPIEVVEVEVIKSAKKK